MNPNLKNAIAKYAEAMTGAGYPTSSPGNYRGPAPGAPPPPAGLGSSPLSVAPGAVGPREQKNAGLLDDLRRPFREYEDVVGNIETMKAVGREIPESLLKEHQALNAARLKRLGLMGAVGVPVIAAGGYGAYRLGQHLFGNQDTEALT